MSYDKSQFRMLTSRLVADGMSVWVLDTVDTLAAALAATYISNAMKTLTGVNAPGYGVAVGDKVIIRRWTDLTSKIAANFLGFTEHYVLALAETGATLSAPSVGAPVIEDAATIALTTGQSGGTIILDKTDGVVVTLPPAQPGLAFDFSVDTAASGTDQKVITNTIASEFMKGSLVGATASAIAADAANGTTICSINLNGTTKGGLPGTWFKLKCRTSGIWEIVGGLNFKSGSVATPFATS